MSQPHTGFDPQFDMNPKPPGMSPAPAPASGMAITSLVMGILGWTALPLLGSLIAVVTGHLAIGQVRREPYRYGGKGMAIAGLILGYAAVVLAALAAIIAVAVVAFFAAVISQHGDGAIRLEHEELAKVPERVVMILIEQTDGAIGEITPEKSLTGDLKLDELDMVEVVMKVEEAFGITLDDAEVDQLKTVQDLIDLVERKVGPGAEAVGADGMPVNALPGPDSSESEPKLDLDPGL